MAYLELILAVVDTVRLASWLNPQYRTRLDQFITRLDLCVSQGFLSVTGVVYFC